MASRPKGYGMTAELADKRDAKWDEKLASEALIWIKDELLKANQSRAHSVDPSRTDIQSVHECLKDGVVLLQLTNGMGLGRNKINESKMAFKMMENINNFLTACENAGVNKMDLFQTVDLYEQGNMPQVISGIHALGRKFGSIGPKEATSNKREFSEDQLKAGQNVIGLQMGTNKGASQAGMNFGKSRQILD